MGGLAGIVGDGTAHEVAAMAACMSYRGTARVWSPAPHVHFAQLTRDDELADLADGNLAIDAAGDGTRRADTESAFARGVAAPPATFRGFFALARWNATAQSLQLICDRHGYKSLHVARLPGRVAFASDYKALLALADVPATVNRDVLHTYLRSRSLGPNQCLLEGITPIRGPYTWTIDRRQELTRARYWKPVGTDTGIRTFTEAAQHLRSLLQAVVRRQLEGRESIALALSGGLDSVCLLALVRNVRPDMRVTTYTVGHGESDPDILGAREGARVFGTDHHECYVETERIPSELRRLVWHSENLAGREEAVLFQVLVERMAQRERAYLIGQGADAAFAGMARHRLMWLRDHAPPPLRGALGELFIYAQKRQEPSSWLGRRLADMAFHGDRPTMPSVIGAHEQAARLRYRSLGDYRRAILSISDSMRFHEPTDAASGIQMIAPFSDPAVLDFSIGCPTAFMIDARRQKRILRAAMARLMPPSMSGRRKGNERRQHDSRLSDVLDDFASQLRLRKSLGERHLVPAEYIAALQNRRRDASYSSERLHILWSLICAELWLRQFIDQRGRHEVPPLATVRAPMTEPAMARPSQPTPTP